MARSRSTARIDDTPTTTDQLSLFAAAAVPPRPPKAERLLTKSETAERLNVTLRFVNRIVAEHRIRYVHVGRHIRVPESAIDEFITAGTVRACP